MEQTEFEKLDELIKVHYNSAIEISVFPENRIKKFVTFISFKDFIEKEIEYWKKFNTGQIVVIFNHFNTILHHLNRTMQLVNNLNQAQGELNNAITRSKINNYPSVFSDTAISKFLASQYASNPLKADGAYAFFSNSININLVNNQTNYLNGIIDSYIFSSIDNAFSNKKESEIQSLEDVRKTYEQAINNLNTYYIDKTEKIDGNIKAFKNDITDWKTITTKSVEEALTGYRTNFDELNKIYEEKLRIEGPAKYWDDLYVEYRKKGRIWMWGTFILSILLITIILFVLYYPPDSLLPVSGKFTITNLKSTILLTLIISVLIYIIRLFVKLSISSFHLSRDAKERHQLTHIFLSMLKDKSIADTDRHIILQSLFSRADTGLLKGDHSPTIPDGILSNITKGMTK